MARTRTGPVWGFLLLVVTTAFIYLLDQPFGPLPALGRLLDPVNGCWANAESIHKDFSKQLLLPVTAHKATVWFDDRLVPHIRAGNDHDVYLLEGYIHALFRLWQMDMETRAAAGRISEVIGEKGLNFDRKQRYKGMVYAAEQSEKAMAADPRTREMMNAYTEGVNQYIRSLDYRHYPLEYKLMGFKPEPWTNLRIALLLKYMADDLSGKTDDIALTYMRGILSPHDLYFFYPERIAGATPVIPPGTAFQAPSLQVPAAPADSVAFPRFTPDDFGERPDDGKGSNNWALSGQRTASGAAILCNDPHLALNLPSLWFTAQLQAPGLNVYGASLPGTPGVIIGFNDSVTWGFTNNYQDVKDFYLVKPVLGSNEKYWFAGRQLDYTRRIETIRIKGKPDEVDTVNYTIHGPVTYPATNAKNGGLRKSLATCWMGHRGTNEMLAVYLMNRAGSYQQFTEAVHHFLCPAQNIAYADTKGNIALFAQGQFVNKWKDQGKYVMDGSDSATLWKELIPVAENPVALNPAQGFVTSANQITTDSTFPYHYNSSGFVNLRAWRLNQLLAQQQKATVQDMMTIQQDTYSWLAAGAVPAMLRLLPPGLAAGNTYVNKLANWNYRLEAGSEEATFFQVWWNVFFRNLWQARLGAVPNELWPLQERTMQLVQDAAIEDGIVAAQVDTALRVLIGKSVVSGFKATEDSLKKLEKTGAEWYRLKNTTALHLAKLPAFSYDHLKIGGWGNTINAAKDDHGPSWRMVVQMGRQVEAWGIYPGGQSGNPGSPYYADYLQDWVVGKYYPLHFFPDADKPTNEPVKFTWEIENIK